MRNYTNMIIFRILFGLMILVLISGCSHYKYIPYEESELDLANEENAIWAVKLPYRSGRDVTISRWEENMLIVTEPGKKYHLSLIDMKDGKPSVKHTQLKFWGSGSTFHFLPVINTAEGILVIGRCEAREYYHVYLLNSETLKRRYKQKISFRTKGKTAIPGMESISDMVIFYQSDLFVKYDFVGGIRYPYIHEIRYSFQIMNIKDGNLTKYENISSRQLSSLEPFLQKERGLSAGRSNVKNMIFQIDKVFLLDDNQTLVFSLSNDKTNLYYSFNVQEGTSSIKEHTAEELAEQYDELMAVKTYQHQDWGELRIKISGVYHEIENLELISDSFIFVTKDDSQRTKLVCCDCSLEDLLNLLNSIYSGPVIVYIQGKICANYDLEKKWELAYEL